MPEEWWGLAALRLKCSIVSCICIVCQHFLATTVSKGKLIKVPWIKTGMHENISVHVGIVGTQRIQCSASRLVWQNWHYEGYCCCFGLFAKSMPSLSMLSHATTSTCNSLQSEQKFQLPNPLCNSGCSRGKNNEYSQTKLPWRFAVNTHSDLALHQVIGPGWKTHLIKESTCSMGFVKLRVSCCWATIVQAAKLEQDFG